jgi:hypothetical protein
MVEINNNKYYTVEDVASISGYKVNTIYNFTCDGILTAPVTNMLMPGYQSRGWYSSIVFEELDFYRKLKLKGMTRQAIVLYIKSARNKILVDNLVLPGE